MTLVKLEKGYIIKPTEFHEQFAPGPPGEAGSDADHEQGEQSDARPEVFGSAHTLPEQEE